MTDHAATAIPPVMRTATVSRPQDEAFRLFTEEIGAWWPLPTHSVFGSAAGGVRFDGGRLVEYAIDGRRSVWGEVVAWEPPRRLSFTWHPGSEESASSLVEVTFTPDGSVTRVDLRHDGWDAFGRDGQRRRRRYNGPRAWGSVLDDFAGAAEPDDDPVDVAALGDAYDRFFAIAEAGGFGPDGDGGWSAHQVVAHVALNDLAMVAVAHAIADGTRPEFDNSICQDRAHLDALVQTCGDMDGLIAFGRACAAMAIATIRRLEPGQRVAEVDCRLVDNGEIVLDAARPWESIAVIAQTRAHLPAHREQLIALRR